jgi:peptidoglycan/xylan/chitin deacetylase (PgdA/CDA1 family)
LVLRLIHNEPILPDGGCRYQAASFAGIFQTLMTAPKKLRGCLPTPGVVKNLVQPTLPQYYASLAPFQEFFRSGVPILTYHKLGPCPRGARLKGMYLSERLFVRQLVELREAGFSSIKLSDVLGVVGAQNRVFSITFDDGFRNVMRYGLASLAQCHCQATQFLVAGRLGGMNEWDLAEGEAPEPLMDVAQVREWLAAGHEIGSHTLTHPWLTRMPLAAAREEISASKKWLEDQFGQVVEHFCYPYGDWNEPVRDLVRESGYRTACTTQFGLNTATTPPWALFRVTARYRTRSVKSLWAWLMRRMHGSTMR